MIQYRCILQKKKMYIKFIILIILVKFSKFV